MKRENLTQMREKGMPEAEQDGTALRYAGSIVTWSPAEEGQGSSEEKREAFAEAYESASAPERARGARRFGAILLALAGIAAAVFAVKYFAGSDAGGTRPEGEGGKTVYTGAETGDSETVWGGAETAGENSKTENDTKPLQTQSETATEAEHAAWELWDALPDEDPRAPGYRLDPMETRYVFGRLATARSNQTDPESEARSLSRTFKELLDSYALQWLFAPEREESILKNMRSFRFTWPDEQTLSLHRLDAPEATLILWDRAEYDGLLQRVEAENHAESDYLFVAVYRSADGDGRLYLLRGAVR